MTQRSGALGAKRKRHEQGIWTTFVSSSPLIGESQLDSEGAGDASVQYGVTRDKTSALREDSLNARPRNRFGGSAGSPHQGLRPADLLARYDLPKGAREWLEYLVALERPAFGEVSGADHRETQTR